MKKVLEVDERKSEYGYSAILNSHSSAGVLADDQIYTQGKVF